MADYISREAAIELLHYNADERCSAVVSDFEAIPAADVEPVRRGKWEPGNPICPVCGKDKFNDLDADIWSDWTPAYCPNCGAKMDLEEETERNGI